MDDSKWHEFSPVFPRKTIDGVWTTRPGQVFRRRQGGRWEYAIGEIVAGKFFSSYDDGVARNF